MIGITADAKTQEQTLVDDGLPMPPFTLQPPPQSLDIAKVTQALKEIDTLKTDVAALKAQKP
jgi:hypothetical protein